MVLLFPKTGNQSLRMQKYKICPACQKKNEPALIECIYCEADLTGVKVTDEGTEKMIASNASETSATELVRICECGAVNPPNARKCSSCGEDISNITPAPSTVEEKHETTFVLSSLDGKYAYGVIPGEITIGRENIMSEYLADKRYVSRAHAKLKLSGGELFVENLSNTNFTYINNKKITGTEKLSDGDEIGLGGTSVNGNRQTDAAYFMVRIGSCT